MIEKQPYFMEKDEWFYYDEKEFKCKLTDKAPAEAVKSYEDFYKEDFDNEYVVNS